ncbi:MAG: class I SAM-dependent methyltransferase [Chloroflexi bacterium]|nr:class I SAM-dependent methyltransferase [Chloroflexota bacterium]
MLSCSWEGLRLPGCRKEPGNGTYEVFGPLPQGAPGNDASTLRALDAVPGRDAVRRVFDLGAGHGRTTVALARALPDARITAVEIHAPFVERIAERTRETGLADRVRAECGDMAKTDVAAGSIDLIWAEGSIYVVGVERALALWRPWLRPGGGGAFSDFVQWTGDLSKEARAFWAVEYPDMASEDAIRSRAEAAGYRVVSSSRMPKEAHDAYYVPLEARITELAGCADSDVRKVLDGIRREIDVVRRFSDEAGYSFFVLRRADGRTGAEGANGRPPA